MYFIVYLFIYFWLIKQLYCKKKSIHRRDIRVSVYPSFPPQKNFRSIFANCKQSKGEKLLFLLFIHFHFYLNFNIPCLDTLPEERGFLFFIIFPHLKGIQNKWATCSFFVDGMNHLWAVFFVYFGGCFFIFIVCDFVLPFWGCFSLFFLFFFLEALKPTLTFKILMLKAIKFNPITQFLLIKTQLQDLWDGGGWNI